MNTAKAIKQLRRALKTDESYRQSWVANIACAVMDEAPDVDWKTRQKIGERFLGWLCVEPRRMTITQIPAIRVHSLVHPTTLQDDIPTPPTEDK